MSQSSITPLASSQINHDQLKIELVEPVDAPPAVLIRWPAAPTVVDPKAFAEVANTVARLFARAHVVLASLKAGGR